MSYHVTVTVPGKAKGQPRPRAFARNMGSKWVARVYDGGSAEGWKSAIAAAFAGKIPPEPLGGAVSVTIAAYFDRPGSHWTKRKGVKPNAPDFHTQKPDADNLAKAVLDCLTTLGLWRDDAQVSLLTVGRGWTTSGNRTEIAVQQLAPRETGG